MAVQTQAGDSSYRCLGIEEYFSDSQRFVVYLACVHYPSNCKLPSLLDIPLVPCTRYLHLMLENCVRRMDAGIILYDNIRLAESRILQITITYLHLVDWRISGFWLRILDQGSGILR